MSLVTNAIGIKILCVGSFEIIVFWKLLQWKLFTVTFFITAKFFTTSIVFAQMYQFSLNLNSLQQKFSLTSNYLGTNSVVVKKVDCTNMNALPLGVDIWVLFQENRYLGFASIKSQYSLVSCRD